MCAASPGSDALVLLEAALLRGVFYHTSILYYVALHYIAYCIALYCIA